MFHRAPHLLLYSRRPQSSVPMLHIPYTLPYLLSTEMFPLCFLCLLLKPVVLGVHNSPPQFIPIASLNLERSTVPYCLSTSCTYYFSAVRIVSTPLWTLITSLAKNFSLFPKHHLLLLSEHCTPQTTSPVRYLQLANLHLSATAPAQQTPSSPHCPLLSLPLLRLDWTHHTICCQLLAQVCDNLLSSASKLCRATDGHCCILHAPLFTLTSVHSFLSL